MKMTDCNKISTRDLVMGMKYNLALIVYSANEWKEAKNKSRYCVLFAYDLTYNPYKHAPLVTVVVFLSGSYENIEFTPGQIIILKEATYQYFEGSYSLNINISARNSRSLVIKHPDKILASIGEKNRKFMKTRLYFDQDMVQYIIFSTYLSTFSKEIKTNLEYKLLSELSHKHLFQSVSLIGNIYKEVNEPIFSKYPEFMIRDPANFTTILFRSEESSILNFIPADLQGSGRSIFPVIIPNPTNIDKYKEQQIQVKFSNLMFFLDTEKFIYGFLYTKLSSHSLGNDDNDPSQVEQKVNFDACKHIRQFGKDTEFLTCDSSELNKMINLGYEKFVPLKFCLFNITVFQDCYVKCRIIDIIPYASINIIVDYCKICKVSRNGEYNDDTKKLECKICNQNDFLYTVFCVAVIADSTEMTPVLLEDSWMKKFLGIDDTSKYSEIRTKLQYFVDMIKRISPIIIAQIDFKNNLLAMRRILYLQNK